MKYTHKRHFTHEWQVQTTKKHDVRSNALVARWSVHFRVFWVVLFSCQLPENYSAECAPLYHQHNGQWWILLPKHASWTVSGGQASGWQWSLKEVSALLHTDTNAQCKRHLPTTIFSTTSVKDPTRCHTNLISRSRRYQNVCCNTRTLEELDINAGQCWYVWKCLLQDVSSKMSWSSVSKWQVCQL